MSISNQIPTSVEEYISQQNLENNKNQQYMLSRYIGKPVIVLSNEIENLTVAIGLEVLNAGVNNRPLLKCYDVVRKKEIIPMSILIAFTEQKFQALLHMDANERIALFYNRESYSFVDKSPTQLEKTEDIATWFSKVKEGLSNTLQLQENLLEKKQNKSKRNQP